MDHSKNVPRGKIPGEGRRNRAIPGLAGFLGILLVLGAVAVPARGEIGRPAPEEGPTRVTLTVFFLDVTEIQSAEQSFTANVYFEARWRDERLAHPGPAPVRKDLQAVWSPRLQAVNRRNLTSTFPDVVEIGPKGDVIYRQRVWGDFSQPLDLRDFPMDRQVYTIQIVAAGSTKEEVELIPDPEVPYGIAKVLSLPDWKVEEWNAETVPVRSLRDKRRMLSLAEFSFTARRKTGYYVYKIIIPLILIVAMSWVVFWIDPKEGGIQIGVSMTAMLTLIAYRFAVGADLPKVAYMTRMDQFLFGGTVLVFATLMEVIVTSTLARGERLELARSIDRWSRVLFPLLFALVTARAFLD
jgi:hypothetical protein